MGGFFHLKQGKMARKIGTQKRTVRGLEAPRNSLDLPVGTYQSYYTQQETHDWYETGYSPIEAPMKKLISDEMTKKPPARSNAPSIVARLMGVDTLPIDTKPSNDFYREKLTRSSSTSSTLSSKSFRQINLNSQDSDSDEWSVNTSSKKPMPREHPQEEELQKFKKEFEAWQTARFKECTKIVENVAVSDQWIAQENLNKEKMALYANLGTKVEKYEDLRKCRSLKSDEKRRRESESESKSLSEDFDRYSAPTKIVILRPGFDNVSNSEEPWASSSGASEDRNKIEDFLEEVKERLKFELQGKSVKRGGGIETPYSERLSDPKEIAQRIAKQVREIVTKDLGTNLLRSESTRSYKGEFQCSGTDSPEFISRDTRKLLSERLRNVLKRESSSTSNSNDENDVQSKSFRCGPDDMILSPVNLVRSLSAPVSGTSFGKLLLEDRNVVTGAHIRRKHEGSEKLMKVKKQRKDKFNLKEKVSSFKYSLSLRARLFGRKIHSTNEFRENRGNDRNFVKDIMNGSTVMMNFRDRPENSTEVPPSPASVCSSIHEEFFRYCASPTPTTPGAPSLDDNDLPQAFRDISSNLSELRKQLDELGTGRLSDETDSEDQTYEPDTVDTENENENEAYIRDLLIASGLYNNSFDNSLSKWDTFSKPITNAVFEQIESSQKHHQNKLDHKVLLDLLNEVLLAVLARRKGTGMRLPRGDTLLDQVWGMLRAYLNPDVDNSFYFFDTMVARDLRTMPWMEFVSGEIDVVAKEVELEIIRDLMEETVKDMVRL